MRLTIRLNLVESDVAIARGSKVLWRTKSEKWAECYGRLVFAKRADLTSGWITRAALCELRGWNPLLPISVGKELSAHLAQTRAKKACVLESKNPTLSWRLAVDSDQVELVPSTVNLEHWLGDRGMGAPFAEVRLDWLSAMVQAQIAFGTGELIKAEQLSWSAFQLERLDSISRQITGMTLVRVAAGRNKGFLVREVVEKALLEQQPDGEISAWGQGALTDFLQSRLVAADAVDSPAEEAAARIPTVQRRLEKAGGGGNPASQAVLNNTLGLLARRAGRRLQARSYLSRAVLLALGIGDLFTLGGAMLNLALTRLDEPRGGSEDVAEITRLLELCVEMDERLAIGRSSAQAEILLARMYAFHGDVDRSESLLHRCVKMVENSGSAYDRAWLNVAHAELRWVRGAKDHGPTPELRMEVLNLLQLAKMAFNESGRAAAYADEQINRVRNRRDLSLLLTAWVSSAP